MSNLTKLTDDRTLDEILQAADERRTWQPIENAVEAFALYFEKDAARDAAWADRYLGDRWRDGKRSRAMRLVAFERSRKKAYSRAMDALAGLDRELQREVEDYDVIADGFDKWIQGIYAALWAKLIEAGR